MMRNPFAAVIERHMVQAESSYSGAQINRLTQDWVRSWIRSADQEIRWDHKSLVGRSRELCRNDPYAKRYLRLLRNNVIGPHGVMMQARVRTTAGDFDSAINDQIEGAWEEWSLPTNCTTDGRLGLRGVCGSIIESLARDGEAIVMPMRGWFNRFGYGLQIVDPDLLDVEYSRERQGTDNEIRMGVELDPWGRAVAYHMLQRHPSDGGRALRRKRVMARDLWHLYVVERPGQTRGVVWIAPAMVRMKWLGDYEQGELLASKAASHKMGFFTQKAELADDPPAYREDSADGEEQTLISESEPMRFDLLPEGVSFTAYDPQHPTTAFGDFEKAILRGISMGVDASYASLSGDLSDVNFTSSRTGLKQEQDAYKWLQQDLIDHFLRPLFLDWFPYAIASGALDLPPRRMSELTVHGWLPRGWEYVQPREQTESDLAAVDRGLNSLTRIAAAQGRDLEEVFAERARENALAKKYGIDISGAKPAFAPLPAGAPNGNGNGNGAHAHDPFPRVPAIGHGPRFAMEE
jgi:lambda family phage portal protein